jgi:glycine cleavage system aminomethyltransferase T
VLAHAEDVSRLDVSSAVAAIQLIGPRAWRLLDAGHLGDGVVVIEAPDRYEVLTAAGDATVVWRRLLEAGRPHGLACVGLEALGHLAASGRLRRRTRSG